ncbi:MAG: hypothetical protein M0R51_15105 [Clostridia bacterium]|nr:hypothetical protein [Clostridia bacterium]
MKKLDIRYIESESGKYNKNVMIVKTENVEYLVYFLEVIVMIKEGVVYLDRERYDSNITVRKYRNIFLCEESARIARKISNGNYKLSELN